MALKPPDLKPMYYENATIYTNSLLDAYMDYKNDFAKADTPSPATDERPFEAAIEGLDLARRSCRLQMVKIVKEVDIIEEHPDYAADKKRPEAIQSIIIFRERLPRVKDKEEVPYPTNSSSTY